MRRRLAALAGTWLALGTVTASAAAPPRYTPAISGSVQGYRLAGVEPDGDPLYQVVLQTRLSPSAGEPAVNLIVSSYLENFQPDTTPVLPDLLHPSQTAQNMAGFLQGKALLTDDAGNVLYIGSFLAEAFLDNTNHTVMKLFGSGTYRGGGQLKGTFSLDRKFNLHGRFEGSLDLSAPALRDLARYRGAKMKDLKSIISVVTVTPHYYGTSGSGTTGPPLHTGFGPSGSSPTAPASTPASSGHQLSPWTIVAGAGAVISLTLAGILYWIDRRRAKQTTASP